MTTQEKLYECFGELIYVVAMAEGVIQDEETEALRKIMHHHPWASQINWSFQYEINKQNSPEYLYNKVLNFCHDLGPNPAYQELINILEQVAKASEGYSQEEDSIIQNFTNDLTKRFINDLDKAALFQKKEDDDSFIRYER